ncbi:MAG: hypothetical protein IJL11_01170, partial [Synergistaceae bacterium]|nr:hypothetical protein [Synergistaceae bacterium]
SLPSWGRGLKYNEVDQQSVRIVVAPFMGAWIEMFGLKLLSLSLTIWNKSDTLNKLASLGLAYV